MGATFRNCATKMSLKVVHNKLLEITAHGTLKARGKITTNLQNLSFNFYLKIYSTYNLYDRD